MTHRCDETLLDPASTRHPLTVTRALRLLIANLDDTTNVLTAATPVLNDLSGCPRCLSGVVLTMTGMAAALVVTDRQERGTAVRDMNARLAELLDETTT